MTGRTKNPTGQIIFIMGVSGTGKTTVGKLLSQKTGMPFFDADDYHSIGNKRKMAGGHPLDDRDREEWLYVLNALAKKEAREKGAIIACSALKRTYQQVLRRGIEGKVVFIVLEGDFKTIRKRLNKRKDHFMGAELLESQFEILEPPADALSFSIDEPPKKIVERIQSLL